jgi:hypothetical protein
MRKCRLFRFCSASFLNFGRRARFQHCFFSLRLERLLCFQITFWLAQAGPFRVSEITVYCQPPAFGQVIAESIEVLQRLLDDDLPLSVARPDRPHTATPHRPSPSCFRQVYCAGIIVVTFSDHHAVCLHFADLPEAISASLSKGRFKMRLWPVMITRDLY